MKKTHPSSPRAQSTKSGFTIIEISFAMAVISVLLIIIATISINLMALYQKGLTIKAVNSVGRGLIDEITSAINSAPSIDSNNLCNSFIEEGSDRTRCKNDNANKFVYQHKVGNDQNGLPVQYSGIFCSGNYSYIWNTEFALKSGNQTLSLTYLDQNRQTQTISTPRLVRFEDKTYRACSVTINKQYQSNLENLSTIDITHLANNVEKRTPEPVQGFLTSFDIDLVLYELTMFPISQDSITLRSFISGTFILATERGGVNITRTGDYCDVEQGNDIANGSALELGSEFNYCGINKFNFAARTAGV